MTKWPDPPGPVQLLVLLFPRTCQRISASYSRFEFGVQSFYPHIIHPALAIILTLVLAVLTGPIGLIVALSLGWLVTFTWVTTSVASKHYPPIARFTLAAMGPALLWTGLGYLAVNYAPASPVSEILSAINRLSKQLEREQAKDTAETMQPKQEPPRLPPRAPDELKPIPPPVTEPKVEKAVLSIELAPRVVTHSFHDEIDGKRRRHWEYGFGIVARIRNVGKTTEYVRALYIVGDVDADYGDYLVTFGKNRNVNETNEEYNNRKPYYRISFVSWPINPSKIEPNDEQFFRFMILDPSTSSTKVILRGTDASRYFGFRALNPLPPRVLTTEPRIQLFVKFEKFLHREPDTKYFYAPIFRDEIKTDALQFQLKMSNNLAIVPFDRVQQVDLMTLDAWNKQTPQDIFFKTGWGDRIDPVERDPVMEQLK